MEGIENMPKMRQLSSTLRLRAAMSTRATEAAEECLSSSGGLFMSAETLRYEVAQAAKVAGISHLRLIGLASEDISLGSELVESVVNEALSRAC